MKGNGHRILVARHPTLSCFIYFRSVEVNISAILDSLVRGYDKRIRPNYGGKYCLLHNIQMMESYKSPADLWLRLNPILLEIINSKET